MKIKKIVLCILLSLALTVTLIPMISFAEEDGIADSVTEEHVQSHQKKELHEKGAVSTKKELDSQVSNDKESQLVDAFSNQQSIHASGYSNPVEDDPSDPYIELYYPEPGDLFYPGESITLDFAVYDTWIDYYTIPLVGIIDENGEVLDATEGEMADVDDWTEYEWDIYLDPSEYNPGRYELWIFCVPCYSDGSYVDGWEEWDEITFVSIDFEVGDEQQKGEVLRISGGTRYITSTRIADYYKDEINGGSKFESVVIATGENFPDALAGSYFANKKNAPIIMINKNVASNVVSYIRRNTADGGMVYVLGGTKAVPNAWLGSLGCKRISGTDRYNTNLEILKEAGVSGGDMLVCTGSNYADALSGSGLDMPIILVGKTLTNDQKAFLSEGQWQFHIVGGTAAVNGNIGNQLRQYDQDGSINRIAGSSRYDTSEKLAEAYAGDAEKIVLATGKAFPDGLCGGPVAYNLDAPLILADPGSSSLNAKNYARSKGIRSGIVLGGTARINDKTAKDIFRLGVYDSVVVY